jgi:AcrR family transcriptional regulator
MADSIGVAMPVTPKQERSKQTREKIIQAAIHLIQNNGYEKTSSNEIAAEAGVSVGSFYTYFADKRQLLLTIFDRLADDLFKNVFDTIGPEHLFDEDVHKNIKYAIANALDNEGKRSGIQRAISEMVVKDKEFAERRKAIMQRSILKLQELISLAKKAGLTCEIVPETAAFVVHRVVFDLSQDYITNCCDLEKDKAIEALSDMIYRYLFKPKSVSI